MSLTFLLEQVPPGRELEGHVAARTAAQGVLPYAPGLRPSYVGRTFVNVVPLGLDEAPPGHRTPLLTLALDRAGQYEPGTRFVLTGGHNTDGASLELAEVRAGARELLVACDLRAGLASSLVEWVLTPSPEIDLVVTGELLEAAISEAIHQAMGRVEA